MKFTATVPAEKNNPAEMAVILKLEAKKLIHAYMKLGVDISRLVESSTIFLLTEDPATGIRRFSPAIAGDDKFYQELSALPWYYREHKPEFSKALSMLMDFAKEGSVLEVGCGNGYFGKALLEKSCSGFKYTGLELNSSAAVEARKKGLAIVEEDIELHAQKHLNHYDAVCSFQVLEHFSEPAVYFSAINRMLRPGGASILSVPAEDSFMAFDRENILNSPPHHMSRWTDKALDLFPKKYGFSLSLLNHLPVEGLHTKAFFDTLISSQLSRQPGALGWLWKHRLPRRITAKILANCLGMASIDPGFSIPGHTVIALHRKDIL